MAQPEWMEFYIALAAGFGVALTILAAAMFFAPDPQRDKLNKRLKQVQQERRELRDAHLKSASQRRAADGERQVQMMRRALKKFNMEAWISDPELKMKLAQAGRRGRNEAVRFLFMRLVAPPVMAVIAFLYLYYVVQPESFDAARYILATLGVGAFGYYLPGVLLSNQRQKRQTELMKAYPEALDLLTICVESGMSIEQAFNRVSAELSGESATLAEELRITTAELSYLGDRRQALENLATRTQLAAVRSITSAMIQAEKYGTPIAQALRVISQEARDEAMARAEQKAASLPAKLTIPMIVFFVPALFVVILGPAGLQMMAN